MAGAMVRAAAAARPAIRAGWGAAARGAAWALGYAALDGALERVNQWVNSRAFRDERQHRGVDIPAPEGTPVLAPSDAVVIGSETTERGGLSLYLAGPRAARGSRDDAERWPRKAVWFAPGTAEAGRDELGVDDSGWRFGFAHLSGTNVQPGQLVRKGQQVATTGATGTREDGSPYRPHLHLTAFWVQDGVPDVHTFVDPGAIIPGIPRSAPIARIGPGAYAVPGLLVRVSTQLVAPVRVVVQAVPAGIAVNWAATIEGV